MGTEKKLSILFHVSRYWPAMAGAVLHTRELTRRADSLGVTPLEVA